jgi:hypothetical protein
MNTKAPATASFDDRGPEWADVLARATAPAHKRRSRTARVAAAAVAVLLAALAATPVFGLTRSVLGLDEGSPGLRLSAGLRGAAGAHGSLSIFAPQAFATPRGRAFVHVSHAHRVSLRWRLGISGVPQRVRLVATIDLRPGGRRLTLCESCRSSAHGDLRITVDQLSQIASGQARAVVVTPAQARLSGNLHLDRQRR